MTPTALTHHLWFSPASLQALCEAEAWLRGQGLFRQGKVLSLEIEPDGEHWRLWGEVQGSQAEPYEVDITLALMPDGEIDFWTSDCTCPVGSQCKHGVALMWQAAHQGLALLKLPSAPGGERPSPAQVDAARQAARLAQDAQQREAASRQLLDWVQALAQAGQPGPRLRAPDSPKPEQYLYLLNVVGNHGPRPQLQLDAVVSYPKLTGGWARPKPLRSAPAKGQAVYDQASDDDHEVLQMLRAMPAQQAYSYAYSASALIGGRLGPLLLETAARTGRLYLDDGSGQPAEPPLRWGEPLALSWQWQEQQGPQWPEGAWRLRPQMATPGPKLCLNLPPLYLDANQSTVGLAISEAHTLAQVEVLLNTPALQPAVLREHQDTLASHLGPLPLPPILQTRHTLRGVQPVARLHLSPVPAADVASQGLILARLRFDYQGHLGWWTGQGHRVLVGEGEARTLLERDTEAELDAITQLLDLGLVAGEQGHFTLPGQGLNHPWMEWAAQDFAPLRERGFQISLDPSLRHWVRQADALQVQLQGPQDDAHSPWFDLSLGMDIDGQRHNILPWLPDLIAAAARLPRDPVTGLPQLPAYVHLPAPAGAAGFVRLPTAPLQPWMAALLELVGQRPDDFAGDTLRLSRLEAVRSSASLGEGHTWQGAPALLALVRQLRGATQLPAAPVPSGLQAQLRPYQQQGLNWLQCLRQHGLGGVLADDMGLGKTLQTLAHLLLEKEQGRLNRPALIVAPVSLLGNWRREAARFAPSLRCLVLHGKERHEASAEVAAHDLIIAPYSLLPRDRETWLTTPWHLVVLDEAQHIKNASTHAAQVVAGLDTRHRLCLSGTPLENHLGEIWSLFHYLMPGFLGSQTQFNQLFRHPIEKQSDGRRLAELRARVSPFLLRRTKAQVADELPPKVETVVRVPLDGAQANLYETIRLGMEQSVREALHHKGLAKSQITVLDALMKLRQVCCHPQLLKLEAAQTVAQSAKLDHLMDILPEMLAEGRRVLVFSQFTSMLSLIEAALREKGLPWVKLTGQTQKRDEVIDRFTQGKVPLFLISLKAGGVGLNLPQADTVIHFDPWWNPAAEAQATDRAHRIGQTQKVWVLRLVAQGTIEERILDLQTRKADLAGSLYREADLQRGPMFTEDDVAELLKPLSIE